MSDASTTAPFVTVLDAPSKQKHWQYLLSNQRLGSIKTKDTHETARSAFHKDYDRLIFSQSFRQLNQKTQVHPLSNAMGIHTRLTHSLEVSCIGRSLGMMAAEKLPQSLPTGLPRGVSIADVGVIVQAACLAHDIGNPPFGHAGEYAIRDWFADPKRSQLLNHLDDRQRMDMLYYEGNAQGFRLLVRNEHHPDAGGMRLTMATLGAFMKYPWLAQLASTHTPNQNRQENQESQKRPKHGCFVSEADQLQTLAKRLHLPHHPRFDGYCRHPLAYLLEAADDICYALIDLEDGILLGMIDYTEVEPIMFELLGSGNVPPEVSQNAPTIQKLAALRGRAMMHLVDKVTDAFVDQSDAMLAGEMTGSLFTHCHSQICQAIDTAKCLARDKIFNHPNKIRVEIMANRCLHTLLDAFMPLALNPKQLSFEQQRLLALLSGHLASQQRMLGDDIYQNMLMILDYLTGLNDHEAYRLSQELMGHWSGVA